MERKLPTPSIYKPENDPHTKEEWDYYFECRKKNDVEIDEETQDEIAHIASNLPFDDEEYLPKVRQIPMPPSWAIRIKHYRGLKALLPYNLIEAKKAYPDEF